MPRHALREPMRGRAFALSDLSAIQAWASAMVPTVLRVDIEAGHDAMEEVAHVYSLTGGPDETRFMLYPDWEDGRFIVSDLDSGGRAGASFTTLAEAVAWMGDALGT